MITLVLSERQNGNINYSQNNPEYSNKRSPAMILNPEDILIDFMGPMLDVDEESDRDKLFDYAEGF